jgi:hypothetical protein
MADTKKVEELQQKIADAQTELVKLTDAEAAAKVSTEQAVTAATAEYERLKAEALSFPNGSDAFKAARKAASDYNNSTLRDAKEAYDKALGGDPRVNSLQFGTIPNLQKQLAAAEAAPEPPPSPAQEDTVKTPEATNPSQSDQATTDAYANPSLTPDPVTVKESLAPGEVEVVSTKESLGPGEVEVVSTKESLGPGESIVESRLGAVPKGAEPPTSSGTSAKWGGAKDLRVYLRVPGSYLTSIYTSALQEFSGILFPYTPEVSYDNQANYAAVNPTHSNYTQYFFKNSAVGAISVTGKFTVQNEKEAIIYLSVLHLLRSLTKMRWGDDYNAGAPPPVCRFDGYGDFMLSNVPVAVASFKNDMPNGVDYISVKSGKFSTSLVPTISTISLSLNLMYSRKEIQDFSVDGWLSGKLKGKGYL